MNNPENERADQYVLKCNDCGYTDEKGEHVVGDLCPECKDDVKVVGGICLSCDEPSPKEYCDVCGDEIKLEEWDRFKQDWV